MDTASLPAFLPELRRRLPLIIVLVSSAVALLLLALGAILGGAAANPPLEPEFLAPFRWPGA